MKPSIWVRIDAALRRLVPFAITLLLLLLTAVPTHLPHFATIAPVLPLMAVYYWAIWRPDLLPAWAAFVLGVLYDVVAGTPLGVNALVLLLVQGIAASQRRFFLARSFLVSWWAFAMLAGGAVGLDWLLIAALEGRATEPSPVFFQYLMTLGLFPPLTWGLARTQLALLKDV